MSTQLDLSPIPETIPPAGESCVDFTKSRGAVFTKPTVVEFMLDLVGYTDDHELHTVRLLEPACGRGSFLLAAANRLLRAWKRSGLEDTCLDNAVRAIELDEATYSNLRRMLVELPQAHDRESVHLRRCCHLCARRRRPWQP